MHVWERFLLLCCAGVIAAVLLGGVGYWAQQDYADQRYWQGRTLLHDRRYEDAAAAFARLGQFRDCPALYDDASYQLNMQLGKRALADARYPQAVQYFTSALKCDPASAEGAVKLQQAIDRKQRENRRIAQQRVGQGDWYLTHEQWPVAYTTYKEAIRYNPGLLPAVKPKLDRARAALGNAPLPAAATPAPVPGPATRYDGQPVGIAVVKAQVTARLELNDITTRQARGNYRYVKLWVAVKNRSWEDVYVNPHEFTLSAGRGAAVPHENDTYILSRYFDGADLPPNGTTAGWLLFLTTDARTYTLHYQGTAGEAETRVAP